MDMLLSGKDSASTRRLLATAGQELSRAQALLAVLPELGYMATAVEQELATVRTMNAMVTLVERSPMVAPHPLLYIQRLSGFLDWIGQSAPGDWAAATRSARFREDLYRRATELRSAQAGSGTVRVVHGGQGVLAPFWAVELPYTFETGALWTKRGKEVPETLLVSATFLSDVSCLQPARAGSVLTDVFALGTGGRSLNGYVSRISGTEQRLSESGGLGTILQSSAPSAIAGRQAIPPLTTETEALRLVQLYTDGVRTANPRAAAQLRASSPRVLDLVYVPASLQGGPPIPWLGALSPASLGNAQSLLGFVS